MGLAGFTDGRLDSVGDARFRQCCQIAAMPRLPLRVRTCVRGRLAPEPTRGPGELHGARTAPRHRCGHKIRPVTLFRTELTALLVRRHCRMSWASGLSRSHPKTCLARENEVDPVGNILLGNPYECEISSESFSTAVRSFCSVSRLVSLAFGALAPRARA